MKVNGLFDLQEKVVLITGATGGLGSAIAEIMAQSGATVVLSDINIDACQLVAGELISQGFKAHPIACDLSNKKDIDSLIKKTFTLCGGVDVLVSNAAIEGHIGAIADSTDTDWQQVMNINVQAALILSEKVIPSMALRGGGSIILMSSIAGLRGNQKIGLYGLSKAALAQLARNLAVEWGSKNIRANAISPGLIRTPLAKDLLANEQFMEHRLASTPLNRVGEPDEIAGVVLMLASRSGGFITGQNIVVDGGTLISDS